MSLTTILSQVVPYSQHRTMLIDYLTESVARADAGLVASWWRPLVTTPTSFLLLGLTSTHLVWLFIRHSSSDTNLTESLHSSCDPVDSLIHFDMACLSGLPQTVNLGLVAVATLVTYFLCLEFGLGRPMMPANRLLNQLIIQRNGDGFFLRSGRDQCQRVRRLGIVVTTVLQVFLVALGTFLAIAQLHLLTESSVLGLNWAQLLCAEVIFGVTSVTGYVFAYTHILMAVHVLTCMGALLFRLAQMRRLMSRRMRAAHSKTLTLWFYQRLERFRSEQIRTLLMVIIRCNPLTEHAFSAYLAAQCPFNCLLMAVMLQQWQLGTRSVVSLRVQLLVLAMAAHQLVCIIGVHMVIATVNGRLHQPAVRFLNCLVSLAEFQDRLKGTRESSTRVGRLCRLCWFVQHYHVRRRYGFTYWRVGRVSMFTFTKYMMLYSQLIMSLYGAYRGFKDRKR